MYNYRRSWMLQSNSTCSKAYLKYLFNAYDSFILIQQKLRARLVPHLRLMTIAMNRVLMKEGDSPLFVYFVVSGEIEMSRRIFNKVVTPLHHRVSASRTYLRLASTFRRYPKNLSRNLKPFVGPAIGLATLKCLSLTSERTPSRR